MLEEIKNIKSGKRQLRQFGLTLGIVLGVWAGLLFFRGRGYYSYLFILSVVFLSLALLAPALLKPVQKIWMTAGICIGWFVTRVILLLLFYLVITPIGILAKIFGKDFLDTKFDRDRDSYWIARVPAKFDKKSYENQF